MLDMRDIELVKEQKRKSLMDALDIAKKANGNPNMTQGAQILLNLELWDKWCDVLEYAEERNGHEHPSANGQMRR